MRYHKWLAIAIGIAASGCALAILLQDALRSGVWTLEHGLIPGMVAIAVGAGHLVGSALKTRKYLSALGFAISFTLATLLTVYTSVSKQADISETAMAAATVSNELRQAKEADLSIAKKRHEEANRMADREMTGEKCGRRCTDWRLRATEVAANIRLLEGDLKSMDPPKPVAVGADKMAHIVSMFTALEVSRVKAMLLLLEPFTKALLFELTAIVAFGYGFGSRPSVARVGPAPATVPSPIPEPAQPSGPPPPPGGGLRKLTRDEARRDLIALRSLGYTVPSQEWLGERWGTPGAPALPGTISKWLKAWEGEGAIPLRSQVGRCKVLEAAD